MVVYSKSFYNSRNIQACAKRFLKKMPKDVTCLVSTGSSGCSIAAAMMALSKKSLKHIYIRKSGESAHFGEFAGMHPKRAVVCFVDDFISQGKTLKRVLRKCEKFGFIVKYALVSYDNSRLEYDTRIIEVDP